MTLLGAGKVSSGAFSPISLSPLIWLDPSDLSTLWKDTAATSAVTTDGDLVARINDKSGNGRNLTQSTASARPAYKTSGGLHWLQFDGVDDTLTYSGAIATQPNIVYAGSGDVTGGNRRLIDGPTGRQIIDWPATFPNPIRIFAGSFINGPSAASGVHVVTGVFNGASSIPRVDGVAGSTANAGSAGVTDMFLYRDAGGGQAAGNFYGILVQSGSTVSTAMETWLGAKMGLTI